jgi:transaldolase
MNVVCLGSRIVGRDLAWQLVQIFLKARFSGAERHRRRIAKTTALEGHTSMKDNPLLRLASLGQSVWLDLLNRPMLTSGSLERLIREDGLRGVTSNPAILAKAIVGSHDYDDSLRELAAEGRSVEEAYTTLVIDDIRSAADRFRPLFDQTGGREGLVSLEVSPHLARDTDGTIAEARYLWSTVERPNVLIKVPGTREGLPAIEQLIAEGINVNVTLLFSLERYRQVAEAYLAGLERRRKHGMSLESIASVASFFISRIDSLVDPILQRWSQGEGPRAELARSLEGEVAVSCGKLAYQIYKEIFSSERFHQLASQGASAQRLLWASTSTKNPAYPDVKYVEALIGPETISTMPLETLEAYRDHGEPASRLEDDVAFAHDVFDQLRQLGIDLESLTDQLEEEGIRAFVEPFDRLMAALKSELAAALSDIVDVRPESEPKGEAAS